MSQNKKSKLFDENGELNDTGWKALYTVGELEWFLRKPDQYDLYCMLHKHNKVVVDTHRRFGKTSTAFIYINEQCIANKITVRVGGVTQKAIKEIYNNVQEHIYYKCIDMLPKYSDKLDAYIFPNGSKICLFGNANSDEQRKSRGSECDIVYLDEYGYWKFKPRETLYSVLIPQLQHSKLKKIIITSTVPKDLTHDYLEQCAEAESKGYYYRLDYKQRLDKGLIQKHEYDETALRMGGESSEDFQREYLLKRIASSKDLVIPEAQDESLYVEDVTRPQYFDPYVFVDLGLKDFTAMLFGYMDFKRAKLVIEDELFLRYKTTNEKVGLAYEIEDRLGYENPKRISDNDMQQLFDLNHEYGYKIIAVSKRSKQPNVNYKESILNGLRIGLQSYKISINPRCKNLIAQLKFGLWNEQRTDFERSESLGHLDGIMALAYGYDNVDWNSNPYPAEFDLKIKGLDYLSKKEAEATKEIMQPRRKENFVRKHFGF